MKTKHVFILFTALLLSISTTAQEKSHKYNAETLVKKSLSLIGSNYADSPNYMNAYYKEMVKQNNSCITTNEALLNIKKSSYLTSKQDQVSIAKIKGECNPSQQDELLVKLQGGPTSALSMDIAKRPFLGALAHEVEKSYTFEYADPTTINNRECYVITFEQKPSDARMLYRGKIYIDKASLAIAKMEYSRNVEDRDYSYTTFFTKRPKGHSVKMLSANYVITYKEYNDKWHFNYSTSDINFNMEDNSDHTYNTYNVNSQIAVTNLIAENLTINKGDLLKRSDILTDKAKESSDTSEWDIYNKIMLIAANE